MADEEVGTEAWAFPAGGAGEAKDDAGTPSARPVHRPQLSLASAAGAE